VASLSVSVALATFNGGAHLGKQLADLAAQSVLPAELVVCDDGSTDDTLAILEGFAATSLFPVRIHRNLEQLGWRANFMRAAGLCRSDLIAFCDQDDRWLPEKIERMRACFADADVLLAFHGADLVDADERRLGRSIAMVCPAGSSPPLASSPWALAPGFTQVFRRWLCECDRWWDLSIDHRWELLKHVAAPAERLAHDQWYFFLAGALGSIVGVPEPLVRYRQHGRNLFGWPVAGRFVNRLATRARAVRWSLAARAQAAEQRALILELAADRLGTPYDRRAPDAATAYRRLADLCKLRAAIHEGRTAVKRAGALIKLGAKRGYAGNAWAFRLNALALDALIGVPGVKTHREAGAAIDPS
jgi:glycosyltransferase involved in cell wall biosynthesis